MSIIFRDYNGNLQHNFRQSLKKYVQYYLTVPSELMRHHTILGKLWVERLYNSNFPMDMVP